MKKSKRWKGVEVTEYMTRHMPIVTLEEVDRVGQFIGRKVSREMIVAMALEYGLSVMVEKYLILMSKEDVGGQFKEDFRTLFGGENGTDTP